MDERIVIQRPVPRADSVRARLADLAWSEGLSAFITNGVPFSFSSGRVLAEGLAHLVDAMAEDHDDVRVMELGAGIGYLSAFCLDALDRDFPETYARSSFVVTDGEAALVDDAKSRGVLDRHGDRARFGVADLRDPASILAERPRLLIMSYLLDAIPAIHTEARDDGTRVARIETSIPADAGVTDGGVWPPRILSALEIATLLSGETAAVTPALARKIVPLLEESWSWVRDEGAEVPATMLNSRRDTVSGLCDLLDDLPDESAVAITDFGYVDSNAIELNEMMTEYGLCAFWAVSFDEIRTTATARGFDTFLHAGDEGETHTLVVYKGGRAGEVSDAFARGFEGMVSDRPRYVLYNLEADAGLDDLHEAIEKIERTMPEADVNAYGNLSRFAHLLLQFGDVAGASRFAERCVERYPEVAAPEMAILGSAAGRNGDLDVAEAMLRRAAETAPGLGTAWLGLSGVYRARQDWGRYFDCVRHYLRTSDCDTVAVMRGIAKTLTGTALDAEAAVARRWVEENG